MAERPAEIIKTSLSEATVKDNNLSSTKSNGKYIKAVNITSFEGVAIIPLCMGRTFSDVRLRILPTENGFRKIEPKPIIREVKTAAPCPQNEAVKVKKRIKKEKTIRFLGSNPTRRGVRLCLTCKGQIGYRSKSCKHCLKALTLSKKPSQNEASDLTQPVTENSQENEPEEKENIIENHCEISVQLHPLTWSSETKDDIEADGGLDKNERSNGDLYHDTPIKVVYTKDLGLNTNELQCLDEKKDANTEFCQKSPENITKNMSPKQEQEQDILSNDHGIETIQDENVQERESNSLHVGSKRKQRLYQGRRKKQRKMPSFILQFVRIEPKPCYQEKSEKNEAKSSEEKSSGQKTDAKRFLSSNATRRGIMPCPLCQKEVGCRSKVCKYCKVAIHYAEGRALDYNNLLIVQLSPLTNPEGAIFSVKKMPTPSEERCFIKQTVIKKGPKMDSNETTEDINEEHTWSCGCDQKHNSTCVHVMFFVRSPKIVQARTATLTGQAIDCLPIDDTFKDKLKVLWEKNQTNELPLVQQVALNTLVVLEPETSVDSEDECETIPKPEEATCVHIRFEKVIRHSLVQPHIFCSGKSCSFWSPVVENQKECPVTCLHYCISLWAIASDNELEEYFKIFLEAPQVYLHSEVFETVVSSN